MSENDNSNIQIVKFRKARDRISNTLIFHANHKIFAGFLSVDVK